MNQIRKKSDNHLFYEALERRLSKNHSYWPTVQQSLRREGGGYAGELRVDRELSEGRFYDSYLVLKNILVGSESSYCQIDTLVIYSKFVLILEVKNIPGILTYDEETHQLTRRRDNGPIEGMGNPVGQLQRSERMVKHFLAQHNSSIPVHGMVVFSNPASILEKPFPDCLAVHVSGLYQSLENLHQLYADHFVGCLRPSYAQQLFVLKEPKITPKKPSNLPLNLFAEIRTGILCPKCIDYKMQYRSKLWRCSQCHYKSATEHLRALQDYRILFSEDLTTNEWMNFCGLNSLVTTRRLLNESNLEVKGGNKNRKWLIHKFVSPS